MANGSAVWRKSEAYSTSKILMLQK